MPMNERQMQQHVISLVCAIIRENQLSARPSTAEVLEALRLPMPLRVKLPVGMDGCRDKDQIYINEALTSAERIEFTIFHEILHILIDREGEIISELHDHLYGHDKNKELQVLESLCQIGAAEFVMPSAKYIALMQENKWRLAAVRDVADQFTCSVIAAAFGFAHHYPGPCTVLICEHGFLPRPPDERDQSSQIGRQTALACLFVAYSIRNHQQKYPMCRHVPVPRTHLIHQAWLDSSEIFGKEVGFFRNRNNWRIHCEVFCHRERAYAAYFPNGPVQASYDTAQLSLF